MLFETVLICLVFVFAVIGLGCAVCGVTRAIFCKGLPDSCVTLIPLRGEDADILLRSGIEQIAYLRIYDEAAYSHRIYAVDCGLGEQMRRACGAVCEDAQIELIAAEELPQIMGIQDI
ncbi:MAG: hypothetical protein ACI4IV_04100 [Acutalibacteraceae bacterium]